MCHSAMMEADHRALRRYLARIAAQVRIDYEACESFAEVQWPEVGAWRHRV